MSLIAEKTNLEMIQYYRAGNSTTEVDYLPTPGVESISIVCEVVLGASAAMTVTVHTADNSSGTNATALTENIPVYLNGVKQTNAKACTVPDTYGTLNNNFVVFEVPAGIIPAGKYLGVACDSGNASNHFSAIAVENTYYKG